jgi:hypothetical protein
MVSPVRPRARDLPAQDCNLMPEHQDLRILRGVIPREEHQPAEHPDHEEIERRMSTSAERIPPGRGDTRDSGTAQVRARLL